MLFQKWHMRFFLFNPDRMPEKVYVIVKVVLCFIPGEIKRKRCSWVLDEAQIDFPLKDASDGIVQGINFDAAIQYGIQYSLVLHCIFRGA